MSRRSKRLLKISLIVAALAYLALHFGAPGMIIYPRKMTAGDIEMLASQRGLTCSKMSIAGYGGVSISAALLEVDNPQSTVLICHGIGDCKERQLELAGWLNSNGYNALVFDLRAHGESEGDHCTYGYYEKEDISLLIDHLESLGHRRFFIWGTSLGGAVALNALNHDDRIEKAVVVSTFSHFRTVVNQYQRRLSGIGWQWLSDFAVWRAQSITGFEPDDINPIAALESSGRPVFLVHGSQDVHIPVAHAERLCEKIDGNGHCHYIEGAHHMNAWKLGGPALKRAALDFLAEN